MNIQYQISYIKEDDDGIEVKVRILEGNLDDVVVGEYKGKDIIEQEWNNSKVIDDVTIKFKPGTTRDMIDDYLMIKLSEYKDRTPIWT